MVRLEDEASFTMAMISIGLYTSLAITCFYFANRYWDSEYKRVRSGRYNMPKFTFFVVLGVSAIFDLPTFITCAAKGGPESCEWSDPSYDFCWCMHLLATVGQQYAVITPAILWSDIMYQKDGNFWNSADPVDPVKMFFRVFWVLFCCVILMTILGVALYPSNTETSQISDCLMPIMIFMIASGCLYTGIRLQRHVINVQLGTSTQRRFLLQLNFLMLFITCTYALRAVMVLSLFGPMPDAYQNAFNVLGSYAVWLPLTQWLPFVFCSFCLVHNMRFKGGGANNRNSTESDASSAVGKGIGMQLYLESGLAAKKAGYDGEEGYRGDDSLSERDTQVSVDVMSPFDHPNRRSRSTDVSVDGFPSRSVSYLLSHLSTAGAEQSATTRLHPDLTAGSGAHTNRESNRESDVYSAFGGGDRLQSQEGFDHYPFRDSTASISSAAGVGGIGSDKFFGAAALQRSVSPTS